MATYIQKVEGQPEKKKTVRGLIKAADANAAADTAQALLAEEFETAITVEKVSPSAIREVIVDAECDTVHKIEVTLHGEIKDEKLDKLITTNFQVLFEVSGFSRVLKEVADRFPYCTIRSMKLSNLNWTDGADVGV